jgi:Zn-finger nucleic acid-binding protein
MLLCPRCGELLERVFEGALGCLQCAGLWLAQPTIDLAFGSPSWPHGSSAWWRIELECPECASEGTVTALVPYIAGDVVIDRCTGHGIWLDCGELGRLMNKPEHEELVALYRRLQPVGELPQSLSARRNMSEAERARRREQGASERTRIAEERRRREAEFASARERREQAETRARERLDAPTPPNVPPIRAPDPEPETKPDLNAGRRAKLQRYRGEIETVLPALEQELDELRDRMRDTERLRREVAANLAELDRSLIGLREGARNAEHRIHQAHVELRAIDGSLDELA